MRPQVITITPATADRDGICAAETMGAAGNMTIGGALASGGVATLTPAGHVSIYAASSNAAKTFTVYGTNRQGVSISEAITGPGAGATVKGSKNFLTVTRVAIDAASVGDVEVGSADELDSQIIPVGDEIDWQVIKSSGADLTWALEYTHDNPFSSTTAEDTINWTSKSGIDPISSEMAEPVPSGVVSAVRIAITAFVSGTVTFTLTPRRAQGG